MPRHKLFSRATFWAREFRTPLFWMTHDASRRLRAGSLVIWWRSRVHLYHLDGRELREAALGRRYFTSNGSLERYRRAVARIRARTRALIKRLALVRARCLPDRQLSSLFEETLVHLSDFASVYFKTEECRLTGLEADQRKYGRLLTELGRLRLSMRHDADPIFYYLIGVLLKEIARRHGLRASDLLSYTYAELSRLFRSGRALDNRTVKSRRAFALVTAADGRQTILTGPEFMRLRREVMPSETDSAILLTGRPAQPGKARGRVRLILHDKKSVDRDVAAFRPGEVLVTEMTRPDTLMACRRAAAIVTDEGGLACHAAIISRELKIPCVVGLKEATRLLKNSDMVEVDAGIGTVRLIRRR